MIRDLTKTTQKRYVATIPADGVPVTVSIQGDYIRCTAISGTLEWSVNGGTDSDLELGATLQGTPGQAEIQFVRLINRTGLPVDVRLLHGMGQYTSFGKLTVPPLTLSSTDKTEIRGAPETLTPTVFALNTSDPPSMTFTFFRAISILNTGPGTILVGGKPVPTSKGLDFPAVGRFDLYSSLLVDATGSSALVIQTKL